MSPQSHLPRTVFAVLRREVGRLMIVGLGNADVGKAYFGVSDQFDGYYLPSAMASTFSGVRKIGHTSGIVRICSRPGVYATPKPQSRPTLSCARLSKIWSRPRNRVAWLCRDPRRGPCVKLNWRRRCWPKAVARPWRA